MLTDPGDIRNVQGALQKYLDARQSLCEVIHEHTASAADAASVQQVIDHVAAASQHLSTLLPPEPEP